MKLAKKDLLDFIFDESTFIKDKLIKIINLIGNVNSWFVDDCLHDDMAKLIKKTYSFQEEMMLNTLFKKNIF
ncbi:hypothetical protein LPB87_04595 [Flavobacterium sp. EDS]|uniref:hypothetical protein n=1 Tax=Flavobacterium sp. EDS TaxID=2897328 RepID=UPI001E437566|nr:hypothetical protein [Flavobacterium sp. EDS]MCD0473670.1 hypothetical protein [Flavobacterium sp. EDS]